ncbi:MAG TPA: polyprenyl synthetase family protein [Clostridiaceae bacterium]|nr:polyprenyl synthetase family protein [Clostridiaceae bacterium]
MEFKEKYNQWLNIVNAALENMLEEKDNPQKNIYRAMKYSLEAGGKRLRPILTLAVCDSFGQDYKIAMPYACAIEMIHTYSLIHDDLPAMDNDDYRRGKLTNHKVFGEAMAILAGNALLNYAFEIMHQDMLKNKEFLERKIKAACIISNASGVSGMIGGQVIDIESQNKEMTLELVEYMHSKKTGALIKAPVLAAAVLCDARTDEMKYLEQYAEKIGLAFQIKDDILDFEGDFKVMGKLSGNDAANNKQTFVTLYGLDKAREILYKTASEALKYISKLNFESHFLEELVDYIVTRDK